MAVARQVVLEPGQPRLEERLFHQGLLLALRAAVGHLGQVLPVGLQQTFHPAQERESPDE
jgi:hypothetical protein